MKNYVLLNAIIGDICGSVYEFPRECRKKEIPDKLINDECHFTDDTIHTIAVSTAIMENPENPNFVAHLQDWSRKYPHAGYGSMMSNWINSDDPKPYNSFGNGSAMRVSPCGYMTMNLELAENSASATHNHPEGIKGAKCISDEIGSILFMKDKLKTPSEIELKNLISEILVKYYPDYDLGVSLDERRSTYKFDSTCQGSVPQSIQCVLESNSYEETIGLAISMGGDSDTMAAISGSIAGCMWEIPDNLVDFAYKRLDRRMIKVIEDFDKFIGR
jgi:ADP-ribosylglycohydrolase